MDQLTSLTTIRRENEKQQVDDENETRFTSADETSLWADNVRRSNVGENKNVSINWIVFRLQRKKETRKRSEKAAVFLHRLHFMNIIDLDDLIHQIVMSADCLTQSTKICQSQKSVYDPLEAIKANVEVGRTLKWATRIVRSPSSCHKNMFYDFFAPNVVVIHLCAFVV